jgi:hypothetical protein
MDAKQAEGGDNCMQQMATEDASFRRAASTAIV